MPPKPERKPAVHTVKRGETLSRVARENGTTPSAIARANGLNRKKPLKQGQNLVLPPPAGAPPAPPKKPPKGKTAAAAGQASGAKKKKAAPGQVVLPCGALKPVKPEIHAAWKNDKAEALYVEVSQDKSSKATFEGKVGAGLFRVKAGNMDESDERPVTADFGLNVATAEVSAHHGPGGLKADASASGMKTAFAVQANMPHNAKAKLGTELELGSAEAKIDMLNGNDGKRSGFSAGIGASAAAAKADVEGEITIPIHWLSAVTEFFGLGKLTDWTVTANLKAGVSGGAIGAGGRVHAYKDLETGRYTMGSGGELAVLFGGEADFDLSIGPKLKPGGP